MSRIEWTDETWNPTTGCDRVSAGCDHCYALAMSARLKAMGQPKYQTDGRPETSGPGFGVQCHPETLDEPLRWRMPRRVFVNSMSDLFHPQVPDQFIARVFATMAATPRHTYQVLTKRPQRMRSLLPRADFWQEVLDAIPGYGPFSPMLTGYNPDGMLVARPLTAEGVARTPLPNVWLGTSVEDQLRADGRIPLLLDTPAALRFLSCEPLLGPVDFGLNLVSVFTCPHCSGTMSIPVEGGGVSCPTCYDDPHGQGKLTVRGLDWVIVGGESGPGARPMDLSWAASIVNQCQQAGVPVFVKQLGSHPHCGPDTEWVVTGKGGDPTEWPPALRVREWPDGERS